MKTKLRTSSSIVNFRERAEKALRLERYDWKTDGFDTPVAFLGLYHEGDFESFFRARAKRYVLWSGGDIQNFKRGYYYGDGEGLKKSMATQPLSFIWKIRVRKTEAEHFCENVLQKQDLAKEGIKARVVPAFWGNIEEFPVSFQAKKRLEVFVCGHPGREKEYGLDYVTDELAEIFPDILFHIYGVWDWKVKTGNVIVHGAIPEDQFNKEIKNYHCFLRLNEHDGFSDSLAKSILLGQYPISKVVHNMVLSFKERWILEKLIRWIKEQKEPFLEARNYYIDNFNKYPFRQTVKRVDTQ